MAACRNLEQKRQERDRPQGKGNGRPDRTPVAFAAPSPLSIPVVSADFPPLTKEGALDPDEWRNALAPRPKPSVPVRLNEHELIVEDDDLDEIVDLADIPVVISTSDPSRGYDVVRTATFIVLAA